MFIDLGKEFQKWTVFHLNDIRCLLKVVRKKQDFEK